MNNMDSLGFPFVEEEYFYLRSNGSGKKKRREAVMENYEVVLFIGDNLTDYLEIFEVDHSGQSRNEITDQYQSDFGSKFIILPNPMYGEWEKEIYTGDFSLSERAKDSLRRHSLKAY